MAIYCVGCTTYEQPGPVGGIFASVQEKKKKKTAYLWKQRLDDNHDKIKRDERMNGEIFISQLLIPSHADTHHRLKKVTMVPSVYEH